MQDPETELHLRKPALFAKCLQLLFCIAEPPLTCETVFSLLQPSNEVYGQLLPQLGSILVEPLPGGEGSSLWGLWVAFRVSHVDKRPRWCADLC